MSMATGDCACQGVGSRQTLSGALRAHAPAGEEQPAALFESLAGIEDKHANEIDARALAPSAVACPELLQTTCGAAFVHLAATIATTAIAARLRDAKSESIKKTRTATCRALATCMQHQSCAGRTRFHLSVSQCYAVQIQLLRGQHHANRSLH